MRNKIAKIKKKLDERMVKKSKKQILVDFVFMCLLLVVLFGARILLSNNSSRALNVIITIITGILYLIFLFPGGYFFGQHLYLATIREAEQRKHELFRNNKSCEIILKKSEYWIYREIINTILVEDRKNLSRRTVDSDEEYRQLVRELIEDKKVTFTAELDKEEKVCICIHYKGKEYYSDKLKSWNFIWFEEHFSVE